MRHNLLKNAFILFLFLNINLNLRASLFVLHKENNPPAYIEAIKEYNEALKERMQGQNNRSFERFQRASELGHVDAHYQTALCYCQGIGTEFNFKHALIQLLKALKSGHIEALHKLLQIFPVLGFDQNNSNMLANTKETNQVLEAMIHNFEEMGLL